jgi:pre-mRNA-splicing factor ATP-dependent RNA helicase DHX38/PRP16
MKSHDHELWEMNRMKIGGAIKAQRNENFDMEDPDMEDEARVALMVHDIKPPFLDGRIIFTK